MTDNELFESLIQEFPEYLLDISDFQIGEAIGEGGFGKVFIAKQTSTSKDCAVKELHERKSSKDHLYRFINEIRIMANCRNTCVLGLIGFIAKKPYSLITEYMPNNSVDYQLYSSKRKKDILKGTYCTTTAIGVAWGLSYLHNLGVVHRDIKTSNVLFDSQMIPKICDFGISKIFDDGDIMTKRIGTPSYIAPEAATASNYDFKVDVYAYAMFLYELSEKKRPFSKMKPAELLRNVVKNGERPQFSKATPSPLRELISKCWSANPEERPAFEEIFEEFRSGRVEFPGTKCRDVSKFCSILLNERVKHEEKRKKISKSSIRQHSIPLDNTRLMDSPKEVNSARIDNIPKIVNSTIQNERNAESSYSPHHKFASFCFESFIESSSKSNYVFDDQTLNNVICFLRTNSDSQQNDCVIKRIRFIMSKNEIFIRSLLRHQMLDFLPVLSEKGLVDLILIWEDIFSKFPNEISDNCLNILNNIISLNPGFIMRSITSYILNIASISNPWPLIDLILSKSDFYLNSCDCYLYMKQIYNISVSLSSFKINRGFQVKNIFYSFISLPDLKIVAKAYDSLLVLFDSFSDYDYNVVFSHMSIQELAVRAVSLLLKTPFLQSNSDYLSLIIDNISKSDLLWFLLFRYASSYPDIVIQSSKLVLLDQNGTDNLLKLFLVIFRPSDMRNRVLNSPLYIRILEILVSKGDEESLGIIVSIITRSNISLSLMQTLDSKGIVAHYINKSKQINSIKNKHNLLVLIDRLSRVAFFKEATELVDFLINMLKEPKLYIPTLHVLISFSYHNECIQTLTSKGLVQYFQKLKAYEQYSLLAEVFLKNIDTQRVSISP